MLPNQLKFNATHHFANGRMVVGMAGWMDGGEVSTGSIETLVNHLDAQLVAQIDPADFYIYNFPGPLELSALFRPHVQFVDGEIKNYDEPKNFCLADKSNELLLFLGKEPNLNWYGYAECLFTIAHEFNVHEIIFVGSVAGLVPHTREPHMSGCVSNESAKAKLVDYNIRLSDYEGPASVANLMLAMAPQRNIEMIALVAEIPVYVQGRNLKCIEAVVRRLGKLLDIDLDLEYLHILAADLEKKLDVIVSERAELAEHIRRLEGNYDQEVFETEMGDLKSWLQQQGIRVD